MSDGKETAKEDPHISHARMILSLEPHSRRRFVALRQALAYFGSSDQVAEANIELNDRVRVLLDPTKPWLEPWAGLVNRVKDGFLQIEPEAPWHIKFQQGANYAQIFTTRGFWTTKDKVLLLDPSSY